MHRSTFLYLFLVSGRVFVPALTAMTAAMGTSRYLAAIPIGAAFDRKDQQKKSKDKYGGGQYKKDFRH